ncbi:MAG TPA: Rpn family recombination-promoting nuclease/putative transposase [Blastocatellia bacterium]|nr:Rpn family recombination-promoting nuclease/putative transposase [Blastocatellia bacterium]
MSDLINPHDRFFKDLLSRQETAVDFLSNYLPSEIVAALDLTAPEMVKDSFIDEELRQHFSDLLYRVNLKRGGDALVYILFEHKSSPDEWVAFQLLRYEVRIWESERRNGAEKLPMISRWFFITGEKSGMSRPNFRLSLRRKTCTNLGSICRNSNTTCAICRYIATSN